MRMTLGAFLKRLFIGLGGLATVLLAAYLVLHMSWVTYGTLRSDRAGLRLPATWQFRGDVETKSGPEFVNHPTLYSGYGVAASPASVCDELATFIKSSPLLGAGIEMTRPPPSALGIPVCRASGRLTHDWPRGGVSVSIYVHTPDSFRALGDDIASIDLAPSDQAVVRVEEVYESAGWTF